MAMLLFEIHSTPRPQKQTYFTRRGCFDPSNGSKQALIWQIKPHAPAKPIEGPVSVIITFYMPIPKATNKKTREQMLNGVCLHVRRPDLDNMAYMVTNAMKELVYEDDSQIVDLKISKRYGEVPKTVIKVIEVDYGQEA